MNAASISVVFFDLGNTLVDKEQRWIEGAQNLLTELRGRQVRLGIISNTGDLNRDRLRNHLPVDFDFGAFDSELILLSHEVGFQKPDPRLFQEAVRRAKASPSECLFCTEDASHSLAAQTVGMRCFRVVLLPEPDIASLATVLAEVGLLEGE